MAIIYSALLFGLTHLILQQSLIACLLGVVIGYLAVQTGSILPCMIFHVVHNVLPLATTRISAGMLDRWPVLKMLISRTEEGGCVYHWSVVAAASFLAVLLFVWLSRLPSARSAEEELLAAMGRRPSDDEPLAA